MSELNGQFFKTWREKWGTGLGGRQKAEEKNRELEGLVMDNILNNGPKSPKDVLAEIIKWKNEEFGEGLSNSRKEKFLRSNEEREVKEVINMVLKDLKNPGNAANCICLLANLKGVLIPTASAFLRFLDPLNHRYAVIDINVAKFLNHRGDIPGFRFNFGFHFNRRGEPDSIKYSLQNLLEYQNYHNWLQEKARELESEGVTYKDMDGKEQPFKPVDIEMAIFAYERLKRVQGGCSD